MKHISIVGLAAGVLMLAGCGGGGGDSAPPSPPPPTVTVASLPAVRTPVSAASAPSPTEVKPSYAPEGIWQEPSLARTPPSYLTLFMQDNGDSWGVVSEGGRLVSAFYGNTKASGPDFNGNGRFFDLRAHTIRPTAYTGNVEGKTRLQMKLDTTTSYTPLYTTANAQIVSPTDAAGSFLGIGFTGQTDQGYFGATVSVFDEVSVRISSTCSAAGKISGSFIKSIRNLQLRFTGAGCALGDGTDTDGMAFYDKGHQQWLAFVMNKARTDGFLYLASK